MRKLVFPLSLAAALCACQSTPSSRGPSGKASKLDAIHTIVVIYAENRGFDNLYGNFPGANGLQNLSAAQKIQLDRDGTPLKSLPPVPGAGLTDASDPRQIPSEATRGLANHPYALDDPHGYDIGLDYKLHDLVHAFYQNQMQINGGRNDRFAAISDAGGETMGHFDGSKMALWKLAQQYTLADNFYQGAFGSSFLNHQYLICACAPFDFKSKADPKTYASNLSVVNADGVSLTIDPSGPVSALDGPPKFVHYGILTPDFYGVNTLQPPYQPSANTPAKGGDPALADAEKRNTLSPQVAATIGDRLSAAGIDWAWYSGAWQIALDGGEPLSKVAFQYHHQPFNYYANFAPGKPARRAHLRDGGMDGKQLLADIDAGRLPAVTFYKPQGTLNQHAGYAKVTDGDAHIADLVAHLQKSPQWKQMVVIITYDENGGWWDHAAPPKGDRWGPGTRIPAIVISPYAKRGFVDHTQYDTGSIQRLIAHRFGLAPLPGIEQRDAALQANGAAPMGDLTNALKLP